MNKKETKSGFVTAVTKAFDGFVQTFKKHGVLTVTFIMLLFLVFYSFIIHPINIQQVVTDALNKQEQDKVEQQKQSIEQRMEADKMINNLMTYVLEHYNVNRGLVCELHNGSTNLNGLEYAFYSATNEVINTTDSSGDDVYKMEYESDNFQKQQIGTFMGQTVYQQLKHQRYLYFKDLDNYHISQYRLITKLKDIGARSCMLIPFVSNHIPIVILILTSKDDTMEADAIYEYIEQFKPQIEKLLMNN